MEHIRQAMYKDLAHIKRLTDEYISVDFYSLDYLQKACDDQDELLYVYTDDNDIPVAYLYMITSTLAHGLEILNLPGAIPGLELYRPESRITVFKTTCTDEEYRNRGILNELMAVSVTACRQQRSERIILTALKIPSGKIPAENSVKRYDFKPLLEVEHPWSNVDSYCPYCKNRYCKCNAVLFVKELD